MSRKYAANWGRFPKSVVFGRAGDSYKRFTQISRNGAAICRELRGKPTPLRDVGFSLAAAFFGAHRYRNAAASPSSVPLSIKRKGQKAKAWFCLLRGIAGFTKFLSKEMKEISVI